MLKNVKKSLLIGIVLCIGHILSSNSDSEESPTENTRLASFKMSKEQTDNEFLNKRATILENTAKQNRNLRKEIKENETTFLNPGRISLQKWLQTDPESYTTLILMDSEEPSEIIALVVPRGVDDEEPSHEFAKNINQSYIVHNQCGVRYNDSIITVKLSKIKAVYVIGLNRPVTDSDMPKEEEGYRYVRWSYATYIWNKNRLFELLTPKDKLKPENQEAYKTKKIMGIEEVSDLIDRLLANHHDFYQVSKKLTNTQKRNSLRALSIGKENALKETDSCNQTVKYAVNSTVSSPIGHKVTPTVTHTGTYAANPTVTHTGTYENNYIVKYRVPSRYSPSTSVYKAPESVYSAPYRNRSISSNGGTNGNSHIYPRVNPMNRSFCAPKTERQATPSDTLKEQESKTRSMQLGDILSDSAVEYILKQKLDIKSIIIEAVDRAMTEKIVLESSEHKSSRSSSESSCIDERPIDTIYFNNSQLIKRTTNEEDLSNICNHTSDSVDSSNEEVIPIDESLFVQDDSISDGSLSDLSDPEPEDVSHINSTIPDKERAIESIHNESAQDTASSLPEGPAYEIAGQFKTVENIQQ